MAPSSRHVLHCVVFLLHVTGSAEIPVESVATVGHSTPLHCKTEGAVAPLNCDRVTWIFKCPDHGFKKLVDLGNVKSERHVLTQNCSLEIKEVTLEDSGHYTCSQSEPGQQTHQDSTYHLKVVDRKYNTLVTFVTVKAGDAVDLSCGSREAEQDTCHGTTWLFEASGSMKSVTLFEKGQFQPHTSAKSGKLMVTNDCSLLVTNVTVSDVGRYTCRQFVCGAKKGADLQTELSVVSMSKHEEDGGVTLRCSVSSHSACRHAVKWLFNGAEIIHLKPWQISESSACETTVTLPLTSLHSEKPNQHVVSCQATDTRNKYPFTFDLQLTPEKSELRWLYTIVFVSVGVAVVAATLLVFVLKYKTTKGNKTQINVDDAGPEKDEAYASISYTKKKGSNVQADPEEVAYASITYTKKKSSNTEVQRKHEGDDDDDIENVTYTTVSQMTVV